MIGERIKRARSAAGLSLRDAAERAELSAMAISKFERGEATPSSQSLIRLSRAFGTPLEFFFRPDTVTLEKPKYRKRASLGKKQLVRIEADILDQVERFVELLALFPNAPAVPFELPTGLPQSIVTMDDVESVAMHVRNVWGLGRNEIFAVADAFEERGILVLTTEVEGESKFDGLATKVNGFPIVVVGEQWPGDRQRFTLGHELGHLVLEGRLEDLSEKEQEKACNRFAGAFLVPRETVIAELGEHRSDIEPKELYQLKHKYGLSMGGWLYRALDVGVISRATYEKLIRRFSANGWRKNEPGKSFPPEKPHFFERLIVHALAEEMISMSKAAELMSIPLWQFREQLIIETPDASAYR